MNKKLIIISAAVMLFLDSIYLKSVSNYYNKIINNIQGSDIKIRYGAVIACYLFLVYGLNYFIIDKKANLWNAFVLGLVIYGVFETTNYAIIKDWEMFAVVSDSIWGGVLFATTTYITYKLNESKMI